MLNKYLACPFVDCGRSLETGLDCWGLALAIRAELGLPVLGDAATACRDVPLEMVHEYQRISAGLEVGAPQVGGLAAVFKGKAFVHVGVVVEAEDRLCVIETNPTSGCRVMPVARFLEAYYNVVFYNDRDISEQA